MPFTIDPSVAGRPIDLGSTRYDYSYPVDLDLTPGSEAHEKIRNFILRRARESREIMKRRYPAWRKIDKNLTSYIPADLADTKVKQADDRKPVNIVIPQSYATLETLLSYFSTAFLQRPVFKYGASSPEDALGAKLLEIVIDRQVNKAKMALDLHTMWRDAFAYGFGAVATQWTKLVAKRTVRKQVSPEFLTAVGLDKSNPIIESREDHVRYEGNKLMGIDPYTLLLDPNIPIHKLQEAEFVGWVDVSSYQALMVEERDNSDKIFNTKYLQHINGTSILMSEEENSSRGERFGIESRAQHVSTKPMDSIYMYASIVPKDLGLGESDYPEKWLFELVGDQVLRRAQPLGLDHEMYPVVVCSPDFDGHGVAPISRLEIGYGLQEAIDFLWNSRLNNIRKTINNMLIVDPEIINIEDMVDTKAGMLARVRRKFWGKAAVKDAVHQLTIQDITQHNLVDIDFLTNVMNNSLATVDSVRGQIAQKGERVSASEFRGAHSAAVSRLEKSARVVSLQAHYDLAYMLASQTIQLMSNAEYVQVIGRWAEDIQKELGVEGFAQVSPDMISVDFDVDIHDGSTPSSDDPMTLVELLRVAQGNQEMMQTLDVPRVIQAIARRSGERNVQDFLRKQPMQPQVVPDEQVQQMVEAGNIVPTNGVAA